MQIIKKIKNYLNKNKKTIKYIFLFFLLFYISNDNTFAVGTGWIIDDKGNWDEPAFIKIIIQTLNLALALISAVLGVMTTVVSWFLTPDWYNWKIFWLQDLLKQLWILVSNIVYTAFAIVLIIIAFMNIINKWDKWELKQALPKFIVWVLLVPISWFIVQFMLSLSGALTANVLLLPHHLIENNNVALGYEQIKGKEIDTKFEVNLWTVIWANLDQDKSCYGKVSAAEWKENLDWEFFWSCNPKTIEKIIKWEEGKNSAFGIVSIYTYAIMSVQELDVYKTKLDKIKKIEDLWQKVVFDVLIVIVYSALMIALFLALFVRGITLWVYTIFSPAFWLLYFFDKSSDWVWDGATKFSLKEFISLAMVPVYVAMAFSFWFIFIMAVLGSTDNWKTAKDWCLLSWTVFTFCINGDIWEDINSTAHTTLWAIGRLLMEIFGIVILWIWVFGALRTSKITSKIVEPIEQFWTQVWQLVMKSPMYAPIIPTGSGKMMSISSAQKVLSTGQSYLETGASGKANEFMKNNKWFGMDFDSEEKIIKAESAVNSKAWPDMVYKKLGEAIKSRTSVQNIADNEKLFNTIKNAAKELLGETQYKKWENLERTNLDGISNLIWALDEKADHENYVFLDNFKWKHNTTKAEINDLLKELHKTKDWDKDTDDKEDKKETKVNENSTTVDTITNDNLVVVNVTKKSWGKTGFKIDKNISKDDEDKMTKLSNDISKLISENLISWIDLDEIVDWLDNINNKNEIMEVIEKSKKLKKKDGEDWFELVSDWSWNATKDEIKKYFESNK